MNEKYKNTIIAVLAAVIIALAIYFWIAPALSEKSYSTGFEDGRIWVVNEIAETGSIPINNGTAVGWYDLAQICGVEDGR